MFKQRRFYTPYWELDVEGKFKRCLYTIPFSILALIILWTWSTFDDFWVKVFFTVLIVVTEVNQTVNAYFDLKRRKIKEEK